MMLLDKNTILLTDMIKHNNLVLKRSNTKSVKTSTGTFDFGKRHLTYKHFPKNSTNLEMGKIEIPGVPNHGYFAIADISGHNIWIIGGSIRTKPKLLKLRWRVPSDVQSFLAKLFSKAFSPMGKKPLQPKTLMDIFYTCLFCKQYKNTTA